MSNAVVNCFLIPFFFFFFFFSWAFNLLIIENRYHDVILNPNWLPNRYNIPLWKTWMFKVCFLNSEHLGQCTRKLQHVWKNSYVYGIVNRLNIFFYFYLLYLGVTYIVPGQWSFSKLKLLVLENCIIIFAALCFFLLLFKKCVSRFVKFCFLTEDINILFFLV